MILHWASKFVVRRYLKTTLSSFPNVIPFSICNNHLLFILLRFYHESRQLFDEMPQRTQSHSSLGFFDVLDLVEICKAKPNVRNVPDAHAVAVKAGVLAHLPTSTSLVIAYARARRYRSSVSLFDEVSCKDVILWNAMMTGSIENERFGDAVGVFIRMVTEGVEFDSVTLVIAVSAFSRVTYRLAYLRAVHGFGMKKGLLSDSDLCNALINAYARRGDLGSSEHTFCETDFRDRISWNSMISGCLNNGHPEKSLRYFKEVVSCGKEVDSVGLSCAIAASSFLLDSGIGNVVHGLAVKLGYDESAHVSVLNALVSFYSKCGDIDAAYTVFRGIYAKDLVSCNTMINGFASNGMIFEAFHLLSEMQFSGSIEPDTVTILAVLSLCAESMLLREGKAIHGFITRRVSELDPLAINSLMNMYAKCTKMAEAESLFKLIRDKDVVSWNTMISGFAQNCESRSAQLLFKKLLNESLYCTLSTVLAVLCSCDSPEFLRFGKSLHSWQTKLGFLNNIIAVNSLLYMYTNCGDLKASQTLLQSVSMVADTACWNAMIVGCVQNGYFVKALETFKLMRGEEHAKPDSVTLVSIVSACGNLESVFYGKLAHGFARKTAVDGDVRVRNALITMYGRFGDVESAMIVFEMCLGRNLCSWNCIISALSQNKEAKTAIHLFQNLDFEPDEITNATILSACSQIGAIRYGKQIHGHVLRSNFHRNCFIVAALVDMYSSCGRLDLSIRIFQSSPEKTVVSWNSMISAYGFHSEGRKAIETFEEMIKLGETPTKTTFINLLSACAHSGLVNEGLEYYGRMFDGFGVEPVTEHHVCVVDMLGRGGRLTEAYEFIERMPVRPDHGVWGAMLSSCNYHGDVEMGKKVAEILFGLEPENAGYYVSLANTYVAAGSWSDAVKLRTFVEDVRLKKPAGYSLVDVG